MTITLAQQLKDRLDKNMADFKATLPSLDKETIITMARKITAMEYAHRRLTTEYEYVSDEVDYLMSRENPLETIAEEWAYRLDNSDVSFDIAISEFLMRVSDDDNNGDSDNDYDYDDYDDEDEDAESDGGEDECLLMSVLKKLYRMCGDINLSNEILTGLLEIGKKLFN